MGNKISKSRTNKEGDPESLSEKFREAFSHHIKVKNDKDVLPPPPYHEEQVAKPAATEEVAGNNNSTTNDAVDATTGNTAKEENKEKHECPRYSVCTGGNVTLHCSDDKTVIITGSGLYCINGRFYGLLTFWSDEKAVKDIYLIDKVYETSAIITRMKFLVEGKSLDPPDSYDDPVEEHKVIQGLIHLFTEWNAKDQ
ncbi:uncharacterized protein L201_007278 [Kwoniella dendrophila CBS 6074]|uniref:Uncharacterized protein n=1 Tax=Kwoniella dendrophila CBS 6074 TaxID=1295534 RepID=A0AAX4K4K2_9TREE